VADEKLHVPELGENRIAFGCPVKRSSRFLDTFRLTDFDPIFVGIAFFNTRLSATDLTPGCDRAVGN
jgi:hypothetical protein